MHFLIGLTALVVGVVIALRRTRPRWFIVATSTLAAVGAMLAVLHYTRALDKLALFTLNFTEPAYALALNIIGWSYVGLCLMTALGAFFVLERRGAAGEELPPIIGDNPLDGDPEDRGETDAVDPAQPPPDGRHQ